MNIEITFPEGSDEAERNYNWRLLGHLTEESLSLPHRGEPRPQKHSVRVILMDDKNQIQMVGSNSHNYRQLPGGRVDEGESLKEATIREAEEETGYIIDKLESYGCIIEEKYGGTFYQFVYRAKIVGEGQTNYTQEELDDDFTHFWIDFDEALRIQQENDDKLREMDVSEKPYGGTFANHRDLVILKSLKD